MRIIASIIIALSFPFVAAQAAPRGEPGPFEACERVLNFRQADTIYKNSAPLRAGGKGTPIVGFRLEPTLIMNKRNNWRRTTAIYDSAGNTIGRCPWATAVGHAGGRFRCTMKTLSLRRAALRGTESPRIYVRLNANQCVEIADAGRCYGSVKGLCPGLLRE